MGMPISLAIFDASFVVLIFFASLLPKIGRLYSWASFSALLLLPNAKIDFEEGPINFTSCLISISANLSFSLKKPYPGCTASALVILIALMIFGILR